MNPNFFDTESDYGGWKRKANRIQNRSPLSRRECRDANISTSIRACLESDLKVFLVYAIRKHDLGSKEKE